jgi:class 3 adenylate cyclase
MMADLALAVENRVVLFTDVHDYSIAFKELADNPYGFLQEMYEALGDIIIEYRGEILKYMGDAMLCVFPAGAEAETVECSLKLRKAFSEMIGAKGLSSSTELEIGIGSGAVALGVFGHRSLRQRDVFGEEVNRAAMIGHHRGVAITERVHECVKDRHKTRSLPDLKVKWQTEPLKIWEVVE